MARKKSRGARPHPLVRKAIYARGLTVAGFARPCGLTKQTIWNCISGRYSPKPTTMRAIAWKLEMDPETLFGRGCMDSPKR